MFTLEELEELIDECTKCSLYKGRTHTVPGNGNPNADIMFISEGPGFHEDRTGKPFIGNAGLVLANLLYSIKETRDSVFVTNIIKCRTNDQNRDPTALEILSCKPFIDAQIAVINPKLIVTLGRFAANKFITGKISTIRGKTFTSNGRTIFPMYHPAYALRSELAMSILEADFKRIPSILQEAKDFVPSETQGKLI